MTFHTLGYFLSALWVLLGGGDVQWGVEVGQSWDRLEGADMGQTHVDHPEVRVQVCFCGFFVGFYRFS